MIVKQERLYVRICKDDTKTIGWIETLKTLNRHYLLLLNQHNENILVDMHRLKNNPYNDYIFSVWFGKGSRCFER
jgi:hypothetical protein